MQPCMLTWFLCAGTYSEGHFFGHWRPLAALGGHWRPIGQGEPHFSRSRYVAIDLAKPLVFAKATYGKTIAESSAFAGIQVPIVRSDSDMLGHCSTHDPPERGHANCHFPLGAMGRPFRRGVLSQVGLNVGSPLASAEVQPAVLRERVADLLARG